LYRCFGAALWRICSEFAPQVEGHLDGAVLDMCGVCGWDEVAERLEILTPLRRPKELGTADENHTVRVTAAVRLGFELDGVVLSDEFMVVPSLRREVIIGAKTMQKWRIKVDMEKEQIIFDPRVGELWLLWLGL